MKQKQNFRKFLNNSVIYQEKLPEAILWRYFLAQNKQCSLCSAATEILKFAKDVYVFVTSPLKRPDDFYTISELAKIFYGEKISGNRDSVFRKILS